MANKSLHTTGAEPTEVEELSGRVLGIIGAYGMGATFDARDLNVSTTPAAPPPKLVLMPGQSDVRDGGYHLTR